MAYKRAAVGFHSIPAIDIKLKRTKVQDEMEIPNDDVFHNILSRLPMEISDDILCNILSRLPPNPLMRFRCVSMHWNSLISDPYFINLRSHPKILLPGPRLHILDNKTPSMTYLPFLIKNRRKPRGIIVLGTFNGIVVLLRTNGYDTNKFVLYNPLTGATKKLPDPPYPCCKLPFKDDIFGFGYGDDPKIIIGHTESCCRRSRVNFCDVFSLKKGSWTMEITMFQGRGFRNSVGLFLNGFLHWFWRCLSKRNIVVLDVKKMVVLRISVPLISDDYLSFGLGTLHGCLCLIEPICNGFNVWVMKEHGVSDSWSKEYKFTLALEYDYKKLHTLCILEDGRIFVMDGPYRIIFCDPSKGSYNVFIDTVRMIICGTGIEYLESLTSPFDLCYF